MNEYISANISNSRFRDGQIQMNDQVNEKIRIYSYELFSFNVCDYEASISFTH